MRRGLLVLSLLLTSACVGDLMPGGQKPSPSKADPARPPVEVVPAPAQVRLLSAVEYRNTVRDLLGLTTSTTLTHADWTGGFDTGAATKVDENLFSALITEGERLAQAYVATRLASDFPCFDPGAITDACVEAIVTQLGRRAYRRPLDAAQRDELLGFFRSVAMTAGDRKVGVEVLLTRLLTAPQFLYRTEVGRPAQPGSDRFALDPFERASLVSYTLTGTAPDEALLADAEAGRLDDERLRAHLRRLWSSPRARERQADFFRQWLRVTTLDQMARAPSDFPKLASPEQGRALKGEFDAFVGEVVFERRGTLRALFSESFTHVDRHTAPLYGLTSASDAPQRVALDPAQRRGILTLASTMAAIGSATDPGRDRPVLRGLMVKKQLLCEEVGAPSAVNTVAAQATAAANPHFASLTTREQYEAMMEQGAACSGCHRQFMPLGFAFGHFDALGRHRTTQQGRAIDTRVADVPFAGELQSFTGAQQLVDALAASPQTATCFSKNFVKFTLGAPALPHTETLGEALLEKVPADELEIARLVEEALLSPHLYLRRATLAPAPPPEVDAGVPAPVDAGVPQPMSVVLMASGEQLAAGASKVSGAFTFINQLDGNLVLYRTGGAPVWAAGSGNPIPGITAMQGDGNLVVYDRDGQPRFNTATHGNRGATLHLEPDGRLHIKATDGRILWSSPVTP